MNLNNILMEIEEHPFFSALVAVSGVLLLLYVFSNSKAINSTSATSPGNSFSPATSTVPLDTIITTQSGVPTLPVATNNPQPVTVQMTGIVRPKATSGPDVHWDNTHPGVPIRLHPSGSSPIVSYVMWNSPVTLVGTSLNGALNEKGGSTSWYQTTNGYISAWDIAHVE
jgi:hypothetical protein